MSAEWTVIPANALTVNELAGRLRRLVRDDRFDIPAEASDAMLAAAVTFEKALGLDSEPPPPADFLPVYGPGEVPLRLFGNQVVHDPARESEFAIIDKHHKVHWIEVAW